jgi:subtilase family serine protease
VVIVENASPSLRHDVHLYDQVVGLDDPQLTVVQPFGASRSDEDSEDVLDVETVHSIAPGAAIVVVDAHTAKLSAAAQAANMIDGASLLRATQYAIEHDLGDVVSQSWGTGETCLSPQQLADAHGAFQEARQRGITVVASAGDQGDIGRNCASATTRGVNFPATDPLVMAVGGTRLAAGSGLGTWQGEMAWNESTPQSGANRATGGGFSTRFARPDYQSDAPGRPTGRAIPDVAYDADHMTGVPTARTVAGTTEEVSGGGTSLGAPSWAAIVALADQRAGRRLGFINAALYRIAGGPDYSAGFHDITQGDNTLRLDVAGEVLVVPGYHAGPGWDPVTGLGSPKATSLAALLPGYQRPTDGAGL